MFQSKVIKNASWLIAGKVAQAVITLIISMISARYLGPSNFGIINYASSVVAFVTPIMNLGITNILVHELVNEPDRQGEIMGSTFFVSALMSGLCILGVVSFSMIADAGETEIIIVCALYSTLLFFQAFEAMIYWFQAGYRAKYSSVAAFVSYALVAAYKIFLLVNGMSVRWFALSSALDSFLYDAILFFLYRKLGGQKLTVSGKRIKALVSQSRYYIISSMMVTIFAQTDKIMIEQMLGPAYTGYYSAAASCAGMTAFLFSSIIDSARPSIFEAMKVSEGAFRTNMTRLYSVIIYLAMLQCVGIFIFARLFVRIIYGLEYMEAVPALRIIVWYTTFAYLGSVRNIWILANQKQKYLWIINLSGALANVFLNALLIPVWGINGASLASLITQFFTNVIVGYILPPIRPNNALMLRSLNPRVPLELLKSVWPAQRRKTSNG